MLLYEKIIILYNYLVVVQHINQMPHIFKYSYTITANQEQCCSITDLLIRLYATISDANTIVYQTKKNFTVHSTICYY